MRFTSAFIYTLLSASTALVYGLHPYAGFRVAVDEKHAFNSITATFKVPQISCRVGDVAYVGVGVGDPLSCWAGIEAGVILDCRDTPRSGIMYRPYWRSYPDIAYFWRGFRIAQGDEMRVEAQVLDPKSGKVKVLIENLTSGGRLSPFPLDTVGVQCQLTASWILRAEVGYSDLKPIPSLNDPIVLYKLDAQDITKNSYGTAKAAQLTMTNSTGIVANAVRDHKAAEPNRTIRIK